MYELIIAAMVLAVVGLVIGYQMLKQRSYGKSRCLFCHKALKRSLTGRATVCHHCGREQTSLAQS